MIAEQWIDARGVRTRVLTAGPAGAPHVLLLHDGGWGASADMSWERVMPTLAKEFQIVAPDMIGYGGTDKIAFFNRSGVDVRKEHLLAVLDRLGIDSAAFVGNSFGGTIAVRALDDPEARARVSAVVSIGGTGGPWKTEKALAELPRFDGSRKDMKRFVELLGIDSEDTDYVDRRLAWAHEPGHCETLLAAHLQVPDGFPRSGRVSRDSFPESLRDVSTPTLLIAGEEDDLLLPEWTRRLAHELAAAQTMVMPTGHSPNVSHPEDAARVVSEFLRSHLALASTAR